MAQLEQEKACAQSASRVRVNGGAVVSVHFDGDSRRVEVLPRTVESLEVASRQRSGITSARPS